MNNIKRMKLNANFINKAIAEATPKRGYEFNIKESNVELSSKFLLISKHALTRLKERFGILSTARDVSLYIQSSRDIQIFSVGIKKDIFENVYKVKLKFGELPAIIFIKEKGGKFIVTTLYADVEDESFLLALTRSFNKEEGIKKHQENAKRDREAFTDFLITNLFGTQENYEEFIKSDDKEEVVKRRIKIIKKKEYKGETFDEYLDNLEVENSVIEVDTSERDNEEVIRNDDVFVEMDNKDDDFEDIMASMESSFEDDFY